MKKLARAIVKMRRLILIAAVLLLIPAAVGAIATPINQAVDFFENVPQILQKIKALQNVGLGYIRLGQSSPFILWESISR